VAALSEEEIPMPQQNNKLERRIHPRYPVSDSGAVMISPNCIISYGLLDISQTGLAFTYNGKQAERWIDKKCTMDFFSEDFSLKGVPIIIISDRLLREDEIPQDNREAVSTLRRCGVHFLRLTSSQKTYLKNYLVQLEKGCRSKEDTSVVIELVS
jgi:c-di-GMP-binding flagellar brake protein YcgR